ncbi:MAG: hypothetical protein IPK93_01930 [Solirubrobacterales bacterium]|nr:hypothetical protein [Solirubrobacterales bacterium]
MTVAAAFVLLLMMAGPQRADASSVPFKIDFNESKIDVNVLKDLPLDTLASDASIDGTLDDNGNVVIPKGKFKMPELGITTPVAIKGFMGIESDATGKFDPATGQLDLDAKAGLWVSVNIKQTLALLDGLGIDVTSQLGTFGNLIGLLGTNLTCGFSPMDVHFSTEGTSLAGGKRFGKGPLGPGSISAEWSKLGPFSGRTKIFGIDACTTIKGLLPGLLSGIGGDALGGIDLGGILNGVDLDNADLGPSGITLTRSVDESTKPDPKPDPDPDPVATSPKLKLKISPRSRKAKAGKTIKYQARVINSGTGEAIGISVCIKAPKKAVKTKKACQNFGTIGAGKAKVRSFKLKIKPRVKGKKYKLGFRTKTSAEFKLKNSASLRVK